MTTIQIKLKDNYVQDLLEVLSNHKEMPIDDIVVQGFSKENSENNRHKKAKLMQIARACASLPTLDNRSPDQILGYDHSEFGLWDDD